MVDIEGNLQPFRIDVHNLIDLVSRINSKLVEISSPIRSIDVTVRRFKNECANIDEMTAILKDIHIPKVSKDVRIWIYGQNRLSIYLGFSSFDADYKILYAQDMSQARSIEDIIIEFFKKYSVSPVFSWIGAIVSGTFLFFVALLSIGPVVSSYFQGTALTNRPFFLLIGISASVLVVYILRSVFTPEPPPISFVHSIVYFERRPNHAIRILALTILVGIVVSVISNWIR